MDILVSFIAEIAKYTVVPLGRQAGYLLFYKDNFKKLVKHSKDLVAARVRVNHSIEDEKRIGKEIETDVLNWLEEVEEVIQEANQLEKNPLRTNAIGCSRERAAFPNLKLRHQLSRKAVKITKDIIQLLEKGRFDHVGYELAPDEVAFSSNTRLGGDEILETRELFKEDILKALKDPNVGNVGVYGLAGVGKTVLVGEIAHIAKQNKLFDVVVKAHISETPDIETIQKDIAKLLGLPFTDESIANRAYLLRHRIKAHKTILIILDDIWTILDLEKVGIPYGVDEHNVCKLLMTSRNEDVLLQMGIRKNSTFRLELLNEPETWRLFESMVGDAVKDITLRRVAIQVAKKCGGLPLGIATLAGTLRDQKVYVWKDALRQLERFDHQEHDAKIYFVLELSYNCLKSEEMKTFFLLFALIEADLEYHLMIGMGLGLFRDVHTVRDARIRLRRIIASLKASCLLLEEDSSNEILMHDRVCDVTISIASRYNKVFKVKPQDELKEWPKNDFQNNCSQIILDECYINELPQRLDCPNIKLFFLKSENHFLVIPDTFFEGMGSLAVLDLTSMNLPVLPTSIRSLTSLKALCLDSCVLENMNVIGALISLQILSLAGSSMNSFPSEIDKLTQLIMLDLSHSGIEIVPPNIISSLTKLEELKMGGTSMKWGYENLANQNRNASLVELQHVSNLTALELQIREVSILPKELKLMFEKLTRYKIAVGDVWEWSDIELETMNTLMLKLDTNIHLEHGIKALIEGVENLFLDEVVGIRNVLYQLNSKGFPLLKHLNVQNNAKIKYIIDSVERNQVQACFPNLETLVLHNLKNLEQICYGPLVVNSFGKLCVIKIKNCIQLKHILSFSMVKGLSQLSKIKVSRCSALKEIVHRGNDSSANDDTIEEKLEFLSLRSLTLEHLETLDNFFSCELASSIIERMHQRVDSHIFAPLFSFQVAFPNLDTLKLSSLNLSKIWDDNQYSMDKLTNLIVENCGGLKYLFSSTIVRNFKSLKRLEINNCHLMEEIIVSKEINNDTNISEEVQFFQLEKVILKDMRNLQTIWHRQFEKVKMLEVNNCEKIVVVFPTSLQKSYNNLEMLEVSKCASVEQIFELISSQSVIEDRTHMKGITLVALPKLKKIWSQDPKGTLGFSNLENVYIHSCERLKYLFPFYVATCCSYLMELSIKDCGNMKEIVAEKKEPMGTAPTFDFNQLNTLVLWNLNKLKGFYAGNHTLECESLTKLNVSHCRQLVLYKTLSLNNHERLHDERLPVLIQQAPFNLEQVIPNLELLRVNARDADMILQAQNLGVCFTKLTFLGVLHYKNEEATFPYWFFQNVRTLQDLVVEWCSFTMIFQDERLISEKIHTRIKRLTLYQLPKLQHICKEGSRIDPVLEDLEYLKVHACHSLTSLLPSLVTFSHMTCLKIEKCSGLVNLIKSSTAQSLVNLATMTVKDCDSIEEIIIGEQNVDIAFISLETLKLECLQRLKKFCSGKCFLKFPMLKEVVVRECPRMKTFCEGNTRAPNLRNVKVAESGKDLYWNDNLNVTINNMFEDKVAFSCIKHLNLSKFPELKESWYGKLQHNVFRNLKHVIVHKCDFLSSVLFQSNLLQALMNLEELDIRDCNSLEAIFDLADNLAEENVVTNSHLKKLTISNLPKLKQVWKEDPHVRYQNLCEVFVSQCYRLPSIFPLSIARDVKQLQSLLVDDCGIKQIVAEEERTKEKVNFVFPHLTSLYLTCLSNFKAFYFGDHSLQCRSLKSIYVFNCQKLTLFMIEDKRHQEIFRNGKLDVSTYQPLFFIDEVLANVESLTLNSKDYDMLEHRQYSGAEFKKVKVINLCEFRKEEATFPFWFIKNIPSLENLVVQWSSFTEIFPCEQLMHEEKQIQISTQIKNLELFQLQELQHIYKEGFLVDPILQLVESIDVQQCSSLIKLVPSSVTFTCLTNLVVTNCNGLINLITSSTANGMGKLKTLKIKCCNLLENVVEENKDETNNEILFLSLETLELISLPGFRRFCSCMCPIIFPLLEKIVTKECPRLEIFALGETTTPNLQDVQIDESDVKIYWEGDLNKTIRKMFYDKVAISQFKYLTLSNYPELNDLWQDQLHHNLFRNLKSLVVQRCDFLSHVLLPSNVLQVLHGLEELDVRDCDSLEAVFDVKGMKPNEIVIKQSTRLKRLTLSNLPKLKHIWNEDCSEIINFGNLLTVDVSGCPCLLNIVPLLLSQDLEHLEVLRIKYCGIKEIIAIGKTEEISTKYSFNFPRLTTIWLSQLTKLESFFPGNHTLECSALKTLNVYRCEAVRMFSFNCLDFHQPSSVIDDIHDKTSGQALFSIEMLSHNLKELAINGTDALRVLNDYCQEIVCHDIEFLRLQCIHETPSIFLNDFHAMFPSLEKFQIRNSSCETLFLSKETHDHLGLQVSNPIKCLWLYELEKLKYIWQEDFPLNHPLLQNLEELRVIDCQSLISLAPTRSSFTSLTYLEVENCKELVYLITSSMAKSLVNLTTLKIKNCEKMLDVVDTDEERVEEDIIFENLEYLELTSLSSLRSFCYGKHTFMFPSLVRFVLKGCPQMKIFSLKVPIAPYLMSIEVENKRMRWKGDLSFTVEHLFKEQEISYSNDK